MVDIPLETAELGRLCDGIYQVTLLPTPVGAGEWQSSTE
jgi:hypothetical protein